MRFWAREIVGWGLVLLGLCVFFFAFLLLLDHYILEGGPLTFMGFIIFRGGVHLLKVAVAARVCLRAQERLEPRTPATVGLPSTTRSASKPVLIRR